MKILAKGLIILMVASAFVSIGAITTTSADVSLSALDAKAGDTAWFTADSFYLDMFFLSDGMINDTTGTTTLDMAGSQIFAKVMNVVPVTGEFYDPVTGSSSPGSSKFIDLATGAILGKDLPVTVEDFSTTIPSGVGIPIPAIFESSTEFGFSSPDYPQGGFFPLYLNDNWNDHEAFIEADADSSTFVTNDDAQFKVETTQPFMRYNEDTGTSEKVADITMSVAWDKSNNLVSSALLEIKDSTTTYVDINFKFDKVENNGLDLEAGDVFNMKLVTGELDVSLEGDAYSPEAQDSINEIKGDLLDAVAADPLIKMTVDKVDGLYYLMSIEMYNTTTDTMEFVASQWFAGFGNIAFDYFLQAGPNMLNQFVVTGPATTPDNYVWGSWDASVQFVFGVMEAQFDELIQLMKDEAAANPDVTQFDLTGSLSLSHTVDTSDGYSVTSSVDLSIQLEVNTTYTNENWDWNGTDYEITNVEGWEYQNFDISISATQSYAYDVRGRLSEVSLKLSGYIDASGSSWDNQSNTVETQSGKVTVNNLELKLDTGFVPFSPETDPPTNNPDATVDTPGLPVPGFELFIGLFAVAVAAVAIRRRKI